MVLVNLRALEKRLPFIFGIVLSAVSLSTAMQAQPIMLVNAGEDSKVAVVKWAAFGSGCRAVEEQPARERDVSFHVLPGNFAGTAKLLFELGMQSFSLNSGKKSEREHVAELYSECALRFAIRGQPGMRVKRIEGSTKMNIQKDKGASLLLFTELKFGQFGGVEKRMEYDEKSEIISRVVDFNLAKSLESIRSDGKSSCGSDQVLFYDFTLFAKKINHSSRVSVSLTAPRKATIRLEFENC